MKNILKIAVVAAALVTMLIPEVAGAQLGRERRAERRRTTVVVGTTVHASDSAHMAAAQQQSAAAQQQAAQQTAAAQQQAAVAQQKAAAAEKEAAVAKQEAAAMQAAGAANPLPMGTVVPALPAGCVAKPIGGVQYYQCGGNYYRAVFQGNSLVYVTVQPN